MASFTRFQLFCRSPSWLTWERPSKYSRCVCLSVCVCFSSYMKGLFHSEVTTEACSVWCERPGIRSKRFLQEQWFVFIFPQSAQHCSSVKLISSAANVRSSHTVIAEESCILNVRRWIFLLILCHSKVNILACRLKVKSSPSCHTPGSF